MTTHAMAGHNNPPDPIDEAIAPFAGLLEDVAHWADGEPVTNDEQMKAVDDLIAAMRSARSSVEKARKAVTDPLHQAFKNEVARWKVTTDDMETQQKCLVALVRPYKEQKLREQEEVRRQAAIAARKAEDEAREAARRAQAGDLEAAREAKAKGDAFKAAEAEKKAAQKDTVKGMRTVTRHEVVDMRKLVNWIATNDKLAMADFANAYAQAHGGNIPDDIVLTTTTREAF